jgi:hypothetical protein
MTDDIEPTILSPEPPIQQEGKKEKSLSLKKGKLVRRGGDPPKEQPRTRTRVIYVPVPTEPEQRPQMPSMPRPPPLQGVPLQDREGALPRTWQPRPRWSPPPPRPRREPAGEFGDASIGLFNRVCGARVRKPRKGNRF